MAGQDDDTDEGGAEQDIDNDGEDGEEGDAAEAAGQDGGEDEVETSGAGDAFDRLFVRGNVDVSVREDGEELGGRVRTAHGSMA